MSTDRPLTSFLNARRMLNNGGVLTIRSAGSSAGYISPSPRERCPFAQEISPAVLARLFEELELVQVSARSWVLGG